ncbi:sigma-54 interaction domain-containing protein [Rhodopirellula bahusiensis]|uniref:sigma-54 interaction domain-containing protein n=1 Tax=Rhodopirellula bahusiensis TaxID=2014065 RepID=UPI0032631E74
MSNASVLILGETGTGKELIASAVHRLSHRSGGPFVKVNCGALSESLLESELFGHVRGAFTGAVANRAGRFEAADGGSIFLDEINSTTLTLQVKLLRVLQEKEFERVGDTSSHRTDARIIAASNRDLMRQVQLEEFREDLYWRLNVVPIDLPALRHRREDIPALVAFFLDHYNEVNDRYVSHLGSGVMRALQDYHWPGNVRELQNYVERAVVMSDTDELVLDALPLCVRDPHHSAPVREMAGPAGGLKSVPAGNGFVEPHQSESVPGAPVGSAALDINRMDLKTLARIVVQRGLDEADDAEDLHSVVVDQVERELISQLLLRCGGVQTKTASRLGMNRNTLSKKMKDYGLNLDD